MTDIITQLTELDPYMDVYKAFDSFTSAVTAAKLPYTDEFCLWAFKWVITYQRRQHILIEDTYAAYLKDTKIRLIKELLAE